MPKRKADPARRIAEYVVDTLDGADDLDEEQFAELITEMTQGIRERLPSSAAPPTDTEAEELLRWMEKASDEGEVGMRAVEDGESSYCVRVSVAGFHASGTADSFFGAMVRCRDHFRTQVRSRRSAVDGLAE